MLNLERISWQWRSPGKAVTRYMGDREPDVSRQRRGTSGPSSVPAAIAIDRRSIDLGESTGSVAAALALSLSPVAPAKTSIEF
ncbi:MAG: hypothetical protein ACO4AI_13465 [Prochlorothrix sp.]|nr:hypothetical protein [Prochlorothrix sp.]